MKEIIDYIINHPETSTAVGGVITALGVGIRKLAKYYWQRFKAQRKLEHIKERTDDLRSIAGVFASMNRLMTQPQIDHVLFTEIGNGGDRPKIGSRIYIRGIYLETLDFAQRAEIMEQVKELQLAEGDINMIAQAIDDGVVKMKTSQDRTAVIQNFLFTQGITYSEFYHVFTDFKDDKSFFMQIATKQEDEEFRDPILKATIHNEIQNQINNFEKFRV